MRSHTHCDIMHVNTTDNNGIKLIYQIRYHDLKHSKSYCMVKENSKRYSYSKNNSSRSLAGQPRIHVLMVRSCDHIQHQVPSSGDLDGLVWQLRCERQGRVHQILGQLLRGLLCLLRFDRFGFHTQPHVNLSRKKERKWRMR